MAEISERTRKWLFERYEYYKEDFYDTHYWEEEHERSAKMMGILGEIITKLGLNTQGDGNE